MPRSADTVERYEYVPMNMPYGNIGFGYGLGEGVGINTSGGVRGYVVIHEYSPTQVSVSVFSDTAVRRLAPNSWRQATVKLIKEGHVLATQTVHKHESSIIAEHDREIFLGSVTLTLPLPVDSTSVHVSVTVISIGSFPEGVVPGKTQKATIPIAVRKVATP